MTVLTEDTGELIKALLSDGGVTKVVVVDNVFGIPTLSEVEEIDDFCNLVEREESLLADLQALNIEDLDDIRDIDDAVVAALWTARDDGSDIPQAAKRTLLSSLLEDYERLTAIVASFESLGLEVTTRGKDSLDPSFTVNLVFLDYYLGICEGSSIADASGSPSKRYL